MKGTSDTRVPLLLAAFLLTAIFPEYAPSPCLNGPEDDRAVLENVTLIGRAFGEAFAAAARADGWDW